MTASRRRDQHREAFFIAWPRRSSPWRGAGNREEPDMGKSKARALYEKLSRQNESLERTWAGLQDGLKRGRADRGAVLRQVRKLRKELDEHFQLEEADGYFDDVVAKAPHLQRESDRLRGQHTEIISAVAKLQQSAGQIGDDPSQLAAVRRLFKKVSQVFHKHETDEGRLLEDAYCRDTAAAD
jgi:phosphoglycerate-specific signal transduction histidine kinase